MITHPKSDSSPSAVQKKSTARDMTQGSIILHLLSFALPLLLGNVFQMLYNTVDSVVVGNYVGTEALAAVGSTTSIIHMLIAFFNGFSVGAGVVISQYFGAKDETQLHKAVETTMAMTFILCIFFSIVGVLLVRPMLLVMSTPSDVLGPASEYLTIYFCGLSGLLLYNMGSGVLRAVGDTTRPLLFLILTSVMNILLDLFFVLVLHLGIAGVAYATILSQFISAVLTMRLLLKTSDIYRFTFADMQIDRSILTRIVSIGLPLGIQTVITAFSNVFVQSYINYFGSIVMAGWSSYNKLDQFIMLPIQTTGLAATTFVSQNIGARNERRANLGTIAAIGLSLIVTFILAVNIYLFAAPAISLFTKEADVISAGVVFVHANIFFLLFNCVNHTLAGALRGRGRSTAPMIIMLLSFVAIRQIYLYVFTHFVANVPVAVGFGYPVGWTACCIIEVTYFMIILRQQKETLKLH